MPTTVGSFGELSDIDLILGDDDDLSLGVGVDALMRWSTGDASDHSVVLALGDTSQMLHITDKAAIATDWNLTSPTDPIVCVHSNTTPATDYLLVGAHDGTKADIDVVGGTTLNLKTAGVTGLAVIGTNVFMGDTANATTTIGLTINQAANDDSILEFKSSDVAHGVTGVTETDTYALFRKYVAANGGLEILGIEDTGDTGLALTGVAVTANATRSTSGAGAIMLKGSLKSTTTVATIGADKNILTVSDNGTVRFVLDTDGDSFQDVGTAWTNFDDHDDLSLLNSLAGHVARPDNPIAAEFGGWMKANKAQLESMKLVSFNEDTDGRAFVNMSKLTMLLVGAVRQIGLQMSALANHVGLPNGGAPQLVG